MSVHILSANEFVLRSPCTGSWGSNPRNVSHGDRMGIRSRLARSKLKGVKPQSRVDALAELCALLSKGGNSAFIAAIASDVSKSECWSLE